MKKLIQVSLVVILVFLMLQATVGGGFSSAEKSLPNQTFASVSSQMTVQSALVVTCWDGRVVSCVKPNVGWNS